MEDIIDYINEGRQVYWNLYWDTEAPDYFRESPYAVLYITDEPGMLSDDWNFYGPVVEKIRKTLNVDVSEEVEAVFFVDIKEKDIPKAVEKIQKKFPEWTKIDLTLSEF